MNKNETKVVAEAGKQELLITREFDAPRELVFRTFTEVELIKQWLGPCDMTMEVETMESYTGGSWRFIHTDPRGNEYGFHGVMHEVLKPARLIRTFEFEGLPETGHVSLEIATFDELPDNRTKLTIQCIFRSVVDRDGMVASGMERGLNDSHENLDKLLAKLQ